MKLLDRAKLAAEQAAAKAKEGVEDVQAKKDLHVAFVDLGKRTFELVEAGELARPELDELVGRIRELKAKLADEETAAAAAAEQGPAEDGREEAESGPPAMPV